ncbi:MAG: flagellar motor switch protein FliM [Nitrospirota bacterium]
MAEKILSQDEVDALLRGVVSGEVDTTPKEEQLSGVRAYDILNQERIIRGRMPTLDMINDRFIRLMAVSWGNTLRKLIDFSLVSTQIVKFGEVLKKFPLPSSLNIFHIDTLRGHGLFVMDAMLVYLLVDHFFGGSGQTHVKPEGRDFTLIQQRIIKTVVNLAFTDLEKAWQPVQPFKISHVRSESNPQFAMVVSVSEIVVAIRFQVQIEENTRDLFLVYPYSMIEPIKEKLYSGFISDHLEQDLPWTGRFREQLQECAVRATILLGTATVRVRDVLNFTPGDVLVLDQSPGDTMTGFVEGQPKFQGNAAVLKGHQALRVTRVLRP